MSNAINMITATKYRLSAVATFMCLLLLVGCGFHLKLPTVWPKEYAFIAVRDTNESTSLAATLKAQLTKQNRNIVDNGEADLTITIVSQDYRSREIASSFDGKNREYIRTLTTVVSAVNKKGEFLFTNAIFTNSQTEQTDETNIYANTSNSIKSDLDNKTIDAILRRVQAVIQ